ncbi:MAG: phosphoglycerate kinase [Desulfobacteraceae bacterium]|nr:phosphoglycerate kinase [Desulfobacteraceae bacterium]
MKSVKDIKVTSKKVFVRVDYNVPVDAHLNITDDNRILATLDLIQYLLDHNAKIILASHMGRPNGKADPKFSLVNVGKRLSECLKKEVLFATDCVGDEVVKKVNQLEDGQILLLENLRFHAGEKDNDDVFSKKLSDLCDIYVNNAFAVSHRDQASVTGIPKFATESVAGFLLEKEVKSYYHSMENPKRPLVAIIGGAKVSSKLKALENMLKYVDKLIIGGAMANTFLNSQGIDTKGSMIEKDLLKTAADIVSEANNKGIDLLLPEDLICAEKFDKDTQIKQVLLDQIPDQWMALDIGLKTALRYAEAIKNAGTIVWNGPMGVFEMEQFMSGTQIVANAIADSSAFSVVGGGDTGLAAKKCNVTDKVGYISTGGGAFLHLMEGKKLPGVVALE